LKEQVDLEKASQPAIKKTDPVNQTNKKLYTTKRKKIQKELDEIPDIIESLEREYQETIQKMASSEFYNQEEKSITETANRVKWLEDEIPKIYLRWQQLEHLLISEEIT